MKRSRSPLSKDTSQDKLMDDIEKKVADICKPVEYTSQDEQMPTVTTISSHQLLREELMTSSSSVKCREELMASSSSVKRREELTSSSSSSSSSSSQELISRSSSHGLKAMKPHNELTSSGEQDELEILREQQYKQKKHVRGIARSSVKKVKKCMNSNAMTEYECFRLHVLFLQKIRKKIQAKIDDIESLYDKDPELYRYRMISREEELAFHQQLFFSKNQVKFIDDLVHCDKLKYDSPTATIAAIAQELFQKHPLETEQIAMKIVKDRVYSLHRIHDAQSKFDIQKWLLSLEFITESSNTCDDLKLLKEHQDFRNFDESKICSELRAYKRFLWRHRGQDKFQVQDLYMKYIRDTRDEINELYEKPYGCGNSILNLAEQVVRGGYVIQDVKEEILKLERQNVTPQKYV